MASVLMGLGVAAPSDVDGVVVANAQPLIGDAASILFYVPMPGEDTPGFETLQRDAQYTWVSNDRLSRNPAMQFTGPGEENIVIEGRMYPYHFGGLSTVNRLRQAGKSGKPYLLMRFYPLSEPKGYAGEALGNFVIKRVRTVESKIGTINIAHKIDFTLELTRYGDDVDAGPINIGGRI
jgi:phage protein U